MSEKVSLNLSIIGVGNAGCQIVDTAKKNGYAVFAINSSQKDLDDSIVDKSIPSFLIGNRRGAGKDRDIAKTFIKTELENLFSNQTFAEITSESNIIIVCGSTAGGTGSGVSPLLINRLQTIYPTKTIIFFGILPKKSESSQAQFNALECIKEVSNKKFPMTYLLADLNKYEDQPMDIAYNECTKYIINCINILRGDKMIQSPYGMIDESDLLTIINEPGYMAIYNVSNINQKELETKSTQSIVINSIKTGMAAPIQRDNIVRKMGIIINTPEQMNDPCRAGNFKELEDYVGYPINTFVNYSVPTSNHGEISLILSGLSNPIDRLAECKEIAMKSQSLLNAQRFDNIEDEIESVLFIKDNQRAFNKSKIIGDSNNSAISIGNIADDIPDIF